VTKAPEAPFGKYQVLTLPDFTGGSEVPEQAKKGIPDKIAAELKKQGIFTNVERGGEATGDSTLLLKGQVVHYNPGSRAARYLLGGLGGGKGSIVIQVSFIDKISGNSLSEASFEGEIKAGAFGGGIGETHVAIAKEIVQFMKSNL